MRNQEHNYQIYELEDGYRIVPRDENRPELVVRCTDDGFWFFEGHETVIPSVPLYSFYALLERTVNLLYKSWERVETDSQEGVEITIYHYAPKWATLRTKKCISKILHRIWKTQCSRINPRISMLLRKLHSTSNGSGNWTRVQEIIQNKERYKYLIDDLIKYNAARICILHKDNWWWDDHALAYVYRDGDWWTDWASIYSYNHETYTSLSKTLMNLPYGFIYYWLFNISNIKLPEPATTRMRLLAYLAVAQNPETAERFFNVILRSTDLQIKMAILYVWKNYLTDFSRDFRKLYGIFTALRTIYDYPFQVGEWDIMGLAKRSVKYHKDINATREREAQRIERMKKENIDLQAKTALPPISLPDNPLIRFLETVGDIYEESNVMNHCISVYSGMAVQGQCYLFHIDYDGETASVEVSPSGYVVQSHGPQNRENKASKYGKNALNRWGKKLRKSNMIPVILSEINTQQYAEELIF